MHASHLPLDVAALAPLLHELSAGLVRLDAQGRAGDANAEARRLLDGPAGAELRSALAELAREGAARGCATVEVRVSAGGLTLRIRAAAVVSGGWMAVVEEEAWARREAQARALRELVAAACAEDPAEGLRAAASAAGGALPAGGVAVYAVDGLELRLEARVEGGPEAGAERTRVPARHGGAVLGEVLAWAPRLAASDLRVILALADAAGALLARRGAIR